MALKSGRVGIHPSQVDPITGMLLSSPGGASDLSDLDDVSIDNPELGQLLVYDGDKWENQFASISPVTPATLASLQDVSIENAEVGQLLVYDGNKWENQFASISPVTPSTLASLQDVALSSVSNDQILRYNSTASKWENEDMPSIPAAQVNSDWNATSGVAEILNKPTIPAAQVNSDWNATSGVAEILNKPTNVSDFTNGYVWTSGVSASAGATTATIIDANITANSIIEVFASIQGIQEPTLSVSTGSCVLTFAALAQNTTFKLRVTN